MYERKVLLGFIRVHILHHAKVDKGIYGVEIIEELGRHGYKISPGTLYPILHEMNKGDLLKLKSQNVNGKIRKVYKPTKKGLEVLKNLKKFVKELSKEVLT
jgi:DNA-binding PadR family transcriptional regulator